MDLKNTIVNSNQNSITLGGTYYEDDHVGPKLRLLAHRETALKLIEKYWASPFKMQPGSFEFQHVESMLVRVMDSAKRSSKPGVPKSVQWDVEIMARELGISPVLLYNDPELPDFILQALKN